MLITNMAEFFYFRDFGTFLLARSNKRITGRLSSGRERTSDTEES